MKCILFYIFRIHVSQGIHNVQSFIHEIPGFHPKKALAYIFFYIKNIQLPHFHLRNYLGYSGF